MNKKAIFDPAAPSKIKTWLTAQTKAGFDRRAIFKALCASGWQPWQAGRMMLLTDEEKAAFGAVPATVAAAKFGTRTPRPRLVFNDVQVDGGDKWVRVLQHRTAPELIEFEGLLSDAECDALMTDAEPRLSRSMTVDVQTGGQEVHADRSSQGMFFTRGETLLVSTIEARIAKLLEWPLENGEGLQILRYPPGAQYVPHHDYFDPAQPGTAELVKRGGQRVATLIMYLHEPTSGGATVFPDIDVAIAPKRGNAVFFSYATPDASTLTLHGGAPVTAGVKWIATKWLRESVFE